MRLLLLLFTALLVLPACPLTDGSPLSTGDICDPDGPERCKPGFCLPLDEETGVCSTACRSHADCPRPLTCQTDEGGTHALCRPGFLCAADTDCPAGHRCEPSSGSCFIPVRRSLCSACEADPQCPPGGRCLEALATGERFCTAPCDAVDGGCPEGFHCSGNQCLPTSGSCQEGRALCAPCRGDAACGDGNDLCVENFLSGERFCGRSCNPHCKIIRDEWLDERTQQPCASECPDNFHCSDLLGKGTGPFQCVPNTYTCDSFCEGGSPEQDRLECGLGRTCDPVQGECVVAGDGRVCAPCRDDDTCNPPGAATTSQCVVDERTGAQFCVPVGESDKDCRRQWGVGFSYLKIGESRLCVPDAGCGNGERRLGEDCGPEGAASCLGGVCLRFGQVGICSGRCGSNVDCGPRYQCCGLEFDEQEGGYAWDCDVATGNAGAICVPSGGGFGEACGDGRTPCADGYCLDLDASQVCTRSCSAADPCPASFRCLPAHITDADGAPSASVPICFPEGGGGPGADCTFGPAACADQLCLRKQSGHVCTQTCDNETACPAGWGCGVAQLIDGQERRVCLPPGLRD